MDDHGFDTLDGWRTEPGGSGEGSLLAGRYRIVRKLGEGGMGMVYLAQDTELADEPVAIKFIPPALAGNARAIKNLIREAQTARKLTHKNIVRLHDLHTDGQQKFLVMEYIEGQTLEEMLAGQADDRLSWQTLEPIATQIAEALDVAHAQGVLHRDLKPSNIMIDKAGVAKVLDFRHRPPNARKHHPRHRQAGNLRHPPLHEPRAATRGSANGGNGRLFPRGGAVRVFGRRSAVWSGRYSVSDIECAR